MSWAKQHIARLAAGETIKIRPRGNSMRGRIESGQLCTIIPINQVTLRSGDIVLCKVKGKHYLHIVKAVEGARYLIANNSGRINGWTSASQVYGKCVQVED